MKPLVGPSRILRITRAAALAVLMAAGLAQAAPPELGQEVSPAEWPAFTKSFENPLTLVVLWEITCIPCVEEMPGLIEVHKELSSRGLDIWEVNTDPESRFDSAARFLEKLDPPFKRFYRKPGPDLKFREAVDPGYGANPFAILFNKSGEKLATFGEAHTKEQWIASLSPYLEQVAPAEEDAPLASVEAVPEDLPSDPFALLGLPSANDPFGALGSSTAPANPLKSPFEFTLKGWTASGPNSGTITVSVTCKEPAHLTLTETRIEKIRGKGIHVSMPAVSDPESHYVEIREETEEIQRTPGEIYLPISLVEGTGPVEFELVLGTLGCTDGPKGVCYPRESHKVTGTLTRGASESSVASLALAWLDPREEFPEPLDGVMSVGWTSPDAAPAPGSAPVPDDSAASAFKDSTAFERVFRDSIVLGFFLAFLGGILTSFTPCVYPMIPATVAIFGAKEVKSRLGAISLAATYIMGVALSYASLGVLAAAVGTVFGTAMESPWVISIVAAFYIILGLSMLDVFVFYLPSSWVSAASKVNRKGYTGAFLMGLVSSVVFAPCGEPILLGILTMVAKAQSFFLGFWLLFVYAWGIGLLFFVIAAFSSSIQYLPKAGVWMVAIKDFFGLLLLGLALYWLHFVLPDAWLWGLATLYFLGTATFIHTKNDGVSGRARAVLSFGTLACLLLGTLPLHRFAATQGWVPGITTMASHTGAAVASDVATDPIQWLSGAPLSELDRAKSEGKPVIVKYRTNVCTKCDEIDHEVFTDPAVIDAVQEFVTIKVNLSEERQDEQIRKLRIDRAVFAVPVIEFYDSSGNLLEGKRVADTLSAEQFLALIRDIS